MRECIIHGDRVTGWAALYDQLSEDLALPEWFGRNLDALFDCLTDLHDSQITIYHWHDLADRLGKKAIALRQMLTEAGLENPSLTVCILDEEPDEI